jgi:predicted nucleic-acid-binding protein
MAQVISLDTNIVVRFLVQDDDLQYRKAEKLFSTADVMITATVLLETEWVLSNSYHFNKAETALTFVTLRSLPNVHFADPEVCLTAIDWHAEGMDFADALHVASSSDVASFATFDRKLVNKAERLATPVKVIPA